MQRAWHYINSTSSKFHPSYSAHGRCCLPCVKRKLEAESTSVEIESFGSTGAEENPFRTIAGRNTEIITPSILQNGFRKTGLVPCNTEAVDYSKVPSVSNDLTPSITSPSIPKEKWSGLEFLEKYIEKEKLASFRSSTDVWEGTVNDHSLFLVWKKIKEDCDTANNAQSFDETGDINHTEENKNKEMEEGIDIADQNQNNEERTGMESLEREEGTIMADQCIMPKNLTVNPHVPQYTSTDGSSKSDNKLIHSPFKRALFWPENTEKAGKRRSKEKIPSVVTSKQWQEYHEKKEEAKLQKERLKNEKAEARRLKKEETDC